MSHEASGMRVLRIRGRRFDLLLLARERSRGLLLREGFRDKIAAIGAKARISHPKMGDTSELLSSHGREYVSSATSLDTWDRIVLKGKDPRAMGHPSPSHQWDMHRLGLFLLTQPWARGTSISPKVLHKNLLLHKQVGWAKAWVEVRTKAHKPGLQGPRGVSTPLHLRLSLQISELFRVLFYSFAYGQECCLILVHLIHSLMHHV